MRQIRKRRHGSGRRQPAPLPADARDPDIVHAHRVARHGCGPATSTTNAPNPTAGEASPSHTGTRQPHSSLHDVASGARTTPTPGWSTRSARRRSWSTTPG